MWRAQLAWAWLAALLLGFAPIARAQDGDAGSAAAARVVSPRAAIPANGAVLIESPDGSQPTVVVTGATGVARPGTLKTVSEGETTFYGWQSSSPLDPGMYRVSLKHVLSPAFDSMFDIVITAAAPTSLPVLESSPTIAAFAEVSPHACCMNAPGETLTHCVMTGYETSARVDPGLSSIETVSSLNQFLYRAQAARGSIARNASVPFMPFDRVAAVLFEGAADEYCISIEAIDITTLAVREYVELNRCVGRGAVEVGMTALPIDDAFLASTRCVRPPPGLEPQWCRANADACEDGPTLDCKLFRYTCEDGPSPLSRLPPARRDQCSIAMAGSSAVPDGGARALTLLVLLILLARRRRGGVHGRTAID